MLFFSPQYVPHAPPISFFLILSLDNCWPRITDYKASRYVLQRLTVYVRHIYTGKLVGELHENLNDIVLGSLDNSVSAFTWIN